MGKTVEIKKVHVRNLFLSFLTGFIILFCLEHFGKFSYMPESDRDINEKPSFYSYVSPDANVASIHFESYFGEKIFTSGNGFKVIDLAYSNGEFYNYKNKLYYITEAFKKDCRFGIYISLGLFILTIFFSIFKFKFV